jgi:hypothetical protein
MKNLLKLRQGKAAFIFKIIFFKDCTKSRMAILT